MAEGHARAPRVKLWYLLDYAGHSRTFALQSPLEGE
jgi:hypothetical protein